jgi:Na+-driven multidrug efflux pump
VSQENAVQNAGGAGFMRRLCNGWFHVPPQETHRSGEIYRKILILGLPILMENLVVQLASLFKKLILGQLHSMEILSAFITANTGMQWPMTVVLTIAMSMMILAARANGEQNDAQVNRILHQGMKLMGYPR